MPSSSEQGDKKLLRRIWDPTLVLPRSLCLEGGKSGGMDIFPGTACYMGLHQRIASRIFTCCTMGAIWKQGGNVPPISTVRLQLMSAWLVER